MANYFEKTNISPRKFVTVTSRYSDATVAYYTEQKLLTFTTYKKKDIPTSASDRFMVIGPGDAYRPDKVSKRAYGVVDFWYKILEANGMKDIMEFKAGENIRIPGAVF